jgi:quinohemoprotein ethanol dehydrogenase
VSPNYNGGHNWQPMAFNPKLNLVYIPARENVTNYGRDTSWKYNHTGFGTGNGWNLAIGTDPTKPMRYDTATKKFPRGMLIAWDPVFRKEAWRLPQTADWNGGLLATATDLVFQGTAEGNFNCLDGSNGKTLWQVNLGGGILAPPVSYMIDDKQYISIAVGWGGGYGMKKKHAPMQTGRVFTFALGAKEAMPEFNKAIEQVIPQISFSATAEEIAHGEKLFWKYCGTCHVVKDGGGGVAPDLAYSSLLANSDILLGVALNGALLSQGMPNFGDRLSEKDVLDIRKYVLTVANKDSKK